MDAGAAPDGADDNVLAPIEPADGSSDIQASPPYHVLPAKPALDDSTRQALTPETRTPDTRKDSHSEDGQDHGQYHGISAATLSPEILQHVFSFVDPISLGRLLSVNRLFNALLDPSKSLPSPTAISGHLQLRPQNDLWLVSRKAFLTGHPRPMEDMSEIEMWRLIRGVGCQYCGKKPKSKVPLLATSPWNAGPGPEGVRAIWPFRCRSCGPCLESRIVKETELLLSSKSVLLQGLPFALLTPSLNYVTSVTLRQTQLPPRLQLTKYYFRPQIEDLDQKQNEVRTFGPAATQEWYKGLEARGQSYMKDAARFEQQCQPGAPSVAQLEPMSAGQVSGSTSPALSMASSAMYSHQFSLQSPHRPFSAQSTPMHPGFPAGPQQFPLGTVPAMPLQNFGLAPGQGTQSDNMMASPLPPQHVGSGPGTFQPPPRPRQERNFQEIDRLKAERRMEIQRRCQELNPPIQPSTLVFMDAFNAAVQIARPLNENDWEILKSRLLGQREEAEQKEREKSVATRASQMEVEDRQKFEEQRRQAQENADRIWNEIQKPSREKVREYADEYIKANWADGRAVNKVSSGKFAAEVLLHVRRRFYETIAQEDTLLASQAMTIPHDSPIHEIRRLKLEDMKFVYEETIRPRTERFGREIFLCSTCEANAKRFTFDAVIQHYAAKHTSALSHGNAVVYWRADWPAEPPFHPAPDTVWNRPPEHRPMFPQYGATSPAYTPAYTPYPGASWMSPLAPGQPNGIYHVQCEELVASAKRIWDATDQIRYLPDSMRLHVVIHQLAMSFSRRFTNEPTLSMFTDCVNHKPLLKPLKDLRGLICRACRTFGESSGDSDAEYTLPDLLQHFQRTHIEYDASSPQIRPMSMSTVSASRMDWKFDMIDLPPDSTIRSIIHAPGMDQNKLEIIAEALPAYFPHPVPRIDPIPFTQEYLPHRPPLSSVDGPGFVADDPRAPFKRPLEEDAYSYPPPVRRVVEYDPCRPEISSFERYRADGSSAGYRPYAPGEPGGRIVYVKRDYAPQAHDYGPEPFRTQVGAARYPTREVIYEEPPRHVIREVLDDYSAMPRFDGRHSELIEPVPDMLSQGRLTQPPSAPSNEDDQYRGRDDALSAAQKFLDNFDSIAEDDDGPAPSRFDAQGHLARSGSRSHAPTPTRSRQDLDRPVDLGPGSRRHSPRPSLPERHRSRNESPIPPLDGAVRTPQREAFALHNEDAVVRNDVLLASPPVPPGRTDRRDDWRRSPLRRYDEDELSTRGEGAVPYEYDQYADEMPRRPMYRREPLSPEIRYRRYEERRPVRYVEVLANGQRRVVEELSSPTFERMEYVGGPPREPHYMDRGGYYVERPGSSGQRLPYEDHRVGPAGHLLFERERRYHPYGYGGGPSSHDLGLPPPPPPGLRGIKYEDQSYTEPGGNEAHR